DLAQLVSHEPVSSAENIKYGINLNVQLGNEHRYECHVDSNPIEGLLYVTEHPSGTGGELVISNCGDVRGMDEIDRDATRIFPLAGYLIFFDAREFTHYVSPLRRPEDIRIAAAMNFYTPSCPESARPADLNRHLFGVD
ncbi:MAG TPA: 2OG-Fe(II) oxygenase, partial [Candidatus Baltobacteraceae bacterium]|nr:2OG-Fe(II) oxygenase [Candidatus Baltobacteraceae bacterium]